MKGDTLWLTGIYINQIKKKNKIIKLKGD